MLKNVDKLIELFANRPQIQEMFRESELCFKIGAYRAALLFAYSAFVRALKIKIIESGKPAPLTNESWALICEKLESDDTMESKVHECVQRPEFFAISPTLRRSVSYWQDRRNACAHWKDECINLELVETFYYFILNNQYKFSLRTSVDNALREIFSVFDIDVCRPGTSAESKVKILPYLLNDDDIDAFCLRLIEKCELSANEKRKNVIQVMEYILRMGAEKYRKALVDKLRVQYSVIGMIAEENVGLLVHILENKDEYRMCLADRYIEGKSRHIIATSLRRRNMLDEELFECYYNAMLEYDKNGIFEYDVLLMKECGEKFITSVLNGEIDGSNYLYINERADLIYQLLMNVPVDEKFVNCVVLLFGKINYSQWLIERFFYEGEDRVKLVNDLEACANSNHISLPSPIVNAILKHRSNC